LATNSFDKIFYYDAIPGKQHGESQAAYEARVEPDYDRIAQIQALDRVHVALGQIVGRDRRQKGVDVRLAVDMMTHAFRGNISRATLFAGDADFTPLLKSLVAEGMHVTLWHPAQANVELKGAADSARLFQFQTDYRCLTLDGKLSAFSLGRTGGGACQPSDDGIISVVKIGETLHSGFWKNDSLRCWRCGPEGWSFITLEAPGSDLQTALNALEVITNWQIAETGTQWIQQ